jgi:hypothetical protein|tara:strand:+ start:349 stop:507 length:159 start_codon:yes stop_codon:yes gene_type:complete
MTSKELQKKLSNNWKAYIQAQLAMAYSSPSKYKIIPYKNGQGIRRIKVGEAQ